jgi:hypothetical protein
VSPLRVKFRSLSSYLYINIYVFATGATSFLVLASGNRSIDEPSFRTFLLSWNFVNFSLLVLLSPIEALAPKLLRDDKQVQVNLGTLKFWAKISALALIITLTSLNVIKSSLLSSTNIVMIAIYVVVVTNNFVARSLLVATGNFRAIATLTVISMMTSLLSISIFQLGDFVSLNSLYFSVAAGVGAGLFSLRFSAGNRHLSVRSSRSEYGKPLDKTIMIRLTQMSFTAFIQLGLGTTGVIALGILGASKDEMFLYAAISGLALICLGFVNSAAVPMSKAVAAASDSSDFGQLRKIFFRNIAIYTMGLIATAIFVLAVKSTYLKTLAGLPMKVSTPRVLLTVFAIGVECLVVVPKIVLIGLNREAHISYLWTSGFIVYAASMLFPFDPYTRVCVAIIVSGAYIFCSACFLMNASLSQLDSDNRSLS